MPMHELSPYYTTNNYIFGSGNHLINMAHPLENCYVNTDIC
jgi:hypothetical protein